MAISQCTSGAVVAASEPTFDTPGRTSAAPAHAASKLYHLAWPAATWDAYHAAIGVLRATVDGVERQAVSCHRSQVSAYEGLHNLPPAHHEALWGRQSYYRVFSRVNGRPTSSTACRTANSHLAFP